MFTANAIKTILSKANRSDFFYFIVSNLPVRHASDAENRFDLMGEMVVVGLLAGLVILMRSLLAT